MYNLQFLNSAKNELKKLDKVTQKVIKEKLLKLINNPNDLKNNIKSLKGDYKGKYRLRVSSYRVIYKLDNDKVIILVVRIGHRKEIYWLYSPYKWYKSDKC